MTSEIIIIKLNAELQMYTFRIGTVLATVLIYQLIDRAKSFITVAGKSLL